MTPPARSPLDDVSHPMFLHSSNGPNLILVSQLLTEDNYASWSRAMTISLIVKNKIGFIDGTIFEPVADELVMRNAWIRNNNIVMSWIINFVSKDIQGSIMYSNSSKDISDDLKTRFSQTNGPRIFQLRRDLANLTQGIQSVNVYFTKVKSTSTRGQILLMDPLPPISKVFAFISQEERQRSVVSSHVESSGSVFSVKNEAFKRSINNQFYNPGLKKRERSFCTHCNMQGHTVEKCYKLHGYPPSYKQKSRFSSHANQFSGFDTPLDLHSSDSGVSSHHMDGYLQTMTPSQCQQFMNMFSSHMAAQQQQSANSVQQHSSAQGADTATVSCVTCTCALTGTPVLSSNDWILDSGASKHISHNKQMFVNLRSVSNSRVLLPDSSVLIVSYVGDVRLSDDIFLTEDKFFKMIGRGRKAEELYVLDIPPFLLPLSISSCDFVVFCNQSSATVWHKRLGHMPFKKLSFLKAFLPVSLGFSAPKDSCCHVCPVAKQKRLSFPSHNHVVDHVFDLIHCDIWGPYKVPSYNGFKYFITIVDDCSSLKVFGCLSFASTLSAARDKFQPRARSCAFIGYPTGVKGYKLLDIHSKEVFFSRDVVFHEDLFPFTTIPSSSTESLFDSQSVVPLSRSIHLSAVPIDPYVDPLPSSSQPRRHFVFNLSHDSKPHTYKQAIQHPQWVGAMQEELDALEANHTWYKARLVARGFTQQEGVDYIDTFSHFVKLVSVNLLLALAAVNGWELHQLDVNNAFLNGDLHEEVYMDLPLGYSKASISSDDMVIAGPSSANISGFKQRQYTLTLLEYTKYIDCKPVTLPMDPKLKLSSEDGELLADSSAYRRLIGRLLYLTITRPDIAYTVHKLSQFVSAPRTSHMQSKKQVTVSRSSAEAEYRALATTASELVWVKQKKFRLMPVKSCDQLAELFTKALPLPAFTHLLSKMAFLNIYACSSPF
ncbi:PREDICTED: uncharacterized protein LOC105971482 [Erythranthe guttata]|uniref:uncharacterized protein LOC105971482 n=1 Tax=Erythranthe guttata TaxID=4155 RepID=UPI00064E13EF|nr:PREDICTED: uncharacterized protein LOC105971482 [Erythranthe guttata]|eukprot:XP_012851790.1 PREDICTED: uncharacterized protein LOC105971482 [Erythranthe guttata]